MDSVYRRIAKDCLVKWMGTEESVAISYATNDTIQDLENGNEVHYGVGALSSIRAALRSIVRQLGFQDNVYSTLENTIVNGDNPRVFEMISERLKQIPNMEEFVLIALSDIHDQWVLDNSSEKAFIKKEGRGQLHQYTPLELIGWNEVKSDLIFLEPIMTALGVSIDKDKLLEVYNAKVANYADEHSITSKEDIATLVGTGSAYYPALPQELGQKLADRNEVVADTVVTNLIKNQSPLLETLDLAEANEAPTLK